MSDKINHDYIKGAITVLKKSASIPLMSNVSIDATLLDIWQSWNSNILSIFLLARVLFLCLGLLRRQGEDLELVGRETFAVNVLGVDDNDVISERVQVVGGKGSLVAANLLKMKQKLRAFLTLALFCQRQKKKKKYLVTQPQICVYSKLSCSTLNAKKM